MLLYPESISTSDTMSQKNPNSSQSGSAGLYTSTVPSTDKNFYAKHQCPFCEKVFGQKSDLTRHVRRHTGERPFVCSYCGKGFVVTHELKIHQRNVQRKEIASKKKKGNI